NERTANVSAFQVAFAASGLELNEFQGSPKSVETEAGLAGGVFASDQLLLAAGLNGNGGIDNVDIFSVNPNTGFLSFSDVTTANGDAANVKVDAIAFGQDPAFPTLVAGIQADGITTYLVDQNGALAPAPADFNLNEF